MGAGGGLLQQLFDVQALGGITVVMVDMQSILRHQRGERFPEGGVFGRARTVVQFKRSTLRVQGVRHGLERRDADATRQQHAVRGRIRQRKSIARLADGEQLAHAHLIVHGLRATPSLGFAQHAQRPALVVLRVAGQGIGTHHAAGQVHVHMRAGGHWWQWGAGRVHQFEGVDGRRLEPDGLHPQPQGVDAGLGQHALGQRSVHAALLASTSCCSASMRSRT